MRSVNIHVAKTHLSRLLDEVSHGAEITIAKAGKPIARLVPVSPATPKRTLGILRGHIRIAEDFDAPLPADILESFEGKQ